MSRKLSSGFNLEIIRESMNVTSENDNQRTIPMRGNSAWPRESSGETFAAIQHLKRVRVDALDPTGLFARFATNTVAREEYLACITANHHRGAVSITRHNARFAGA